MEGEEAGTETGEHHHEGGVPHEDIAVVGDIEVAAYETGIRFRGLDVADADLPSLPVHLDFLLVSAPSRVREDLLGLIEGSGRDGLRSRRPELVLGHEGFLQVGVLVRKIVLGAFLFHFLLR